MTHQRSFFRNGPHHVTRRITEKYEGDVIGITKLHKARCLIGGITVNGAGQMVWVVGNDTHRPTFNAGQGCYHAQTKASTQFQDRIRIEHGMDHLTNVVDAKAVFRNDLPQMPLIGTIPFLDKTLEIAEILLGGFDRLLLVLDGNIHDAIWHLDRHGSDFFGAEHSKATAFDHGRSTHANSRIFRCNDYIATTQNNRIASKTPAGSDTYEGNQTAQSAPQVKGIDVQISSKNHVRIARPAATTLSKEYHR